MPMKIPRYDDAQVARSPQPGVALPANATPDAFGSRQGTQQQELGKALMQVGNAVDQYQRQQDERYDANLFLQADTAIKEKYLAFEGEAKQRRGTLAWGVEKDAGKWWEKARKEDPPKFRTAQAQQMYDRSVESLRLHSISTLRDHEQREQVTALTDSAQASIAASTNWAAANPNGETIPKAEAEIRRSVDLIGRLKGYDAATLGTLREEKLGTLHKQILQGVVNSDPRSARAYFESNKSKIPGGDHAEIEKIVAMGEAKAVAPELARKYITANVTQDVALADVRKNFKDDPNKDLIEREVAQAFAEREAARRDRVSKLADSIQRDFGSHYRMADVNVSQMAELNRLDGSVWAGMKAHMESKIKSLAGEGSNIKTDYKAFATLFDEAGRNPQAFASRNLLADRAKLKDSDFEQLLSLQLSVRNSIARGAERDANSELRDLQTLQQQLGIVYQQLGLGSSDSDLKKKGEFASVVTDALRMEESRIGRKLRDEERQLLINKMTTRDDAPWYRKSRTYAEALKAGEAGTFKADVKLADVPLSERTKIEAALQNKKIPVTEKAIIDLYKRKLGVQ